MLFHDPPPPVGNGGKPSDPDGTPGVSRLVGPAVLFRGPVLPVGTGKPPDLEDCLDDIATVVFDAPIPVPAGSVHIETVPVDDAAVVTVPAVAVNKEEPPEVRFHGPPEAVVDPGVAVPLVDKSELGEIAVPSAESAGSFDDSADLPEAELVDESVGVPFLIAVVVLPVCVPVVVKLEDAGDLLIASELGEVSVGYTELDLDPAEACDEDVSDDSGGLYSEDSVGCPRPRPLVASALVDDPFAKMHSHWSLLTSCSKRLYG